MNAFPIYARVFIFFQVICGKRSSMNSFPRMLYKEYSFEMYSHCVLLTLFFFACRCVFSTFIQLLLFPEFCLFIFPCRSESVESCEHGDLASEEEVSRPGLLVDPSSSEEEDQKAKEAYRSARRWHKAIASRRAKNKRDSRMLEKRRRQQVPEWVFLSQW